MASKRKGCVYNPRMKKWVKALGGKRGFKVCKGKGFSGTGKLGSTKGKTCRRFKTVTMVRNGKRSRVRRCADYR